MVRRLLHAVSAMVLLIAVVGSWDLLRLALVCAAVVALLLDWARTRLSTWGDYLERLAPLFKPAEANRLNGATWLCVGYALASWFPPMAPAGGILVAALADPAAALAGGLAGPSRGKTAHGSVAALMVSLVALVVVPVIYTLLDDLTVRLTARKRSAKPVSRCRASCSSVQMGSSDRLPLVATTGTPRSASRR